MCVCVFSSNLFWTSSSLDVPAGVTQEEGHTGFLINLPSAVYAFIINVYVQAKIKNIAFYAEINTIFTSLKLICRRFVSQWRA